MFEQILIQTAASLLTTLVGAAVGRWRARLRWEWRPPEELR